MRKKIINIRRKLEKNGDREKRYYTEDRGKEEIILIGKRIQEKKACEKGRRVETGLGSWIHNRK